MNNSTISINRAKAIIMTERALDALQNRSTEIRANQWNKLRDFLFKYMADWNFQKINASPVFQDLSQHFQQYLSILKIEANNKEDLLKCIDDFLFKEFGSKRSKKFSESNFFYYHNGDCNEFNGLNEKIDSVKVYLEAFKLHDKECKETIKLSISDFKFLYECLSVKTKEDKDNKDNKDD